MRRMSKRNWISGLRFSLRGWPGRAGNGQPAIGGVRFGDLARTAPIDGNFGFGRGTPVDRFYIESSLTGIAKTLPGASWK